MVYKGEHPIKMDDLIRGSPILGSLYIKWIPGFVDDISHLYPISSYYNYIRNLQL